jgi:hypothetical protein
MLTSTPVPCAFWYSHDLTTDPDTCSLDDFPVTDNPPPAPDLVRPVRDLQVNEELVSDHVDPDSIQTQVQPADQELPQTQNIDLSGRPPKRIRVRGPHDTNANLVRIHPHNFPLKVINLCLCVKCYCSYPSLLTGFSKNRFCLPVPSTSDTRDIQYTVTRMYCSCLQVPLLSTTRHQAVPGHSFPVQLCPVFEHMPKATFSDNLADPASVRYLPVCLPKCISVSRLITLSISIGDVPLHSFQPQILIPFRYHCAYRCRSSRIPTSTSPKRNW